MKFKKIYDLTQPFYHNCPGWPDFAPPKVERMLYIPKDVCNVETMEFNTHTATHIDAPYHFLPDGKALDQIPVERFIGEGIVLDLRFKKENEFITVEDLEKVGSKIKKGDIVMLATGFGKARGFNHKYLKNFPAINGKAAQWLVDRQINILGVDTLGVETYGFPEGPLVHRTLLGAEILILEELFLEPLFSAATQRFTFICLPILLKDAGGCLARVVAVEE